MNKAEDKAKTIEDKITQLAERYPEVSFAKLSRIAKAAYEFGIRQQLTWRDIASIVILADTILDGNEKEWKKRGAQEFYQVVLDAFNKKWECQQ